MQYLKTKLVVVLLITSASTSAFASRDGSSSIDRLDVDGDGLVSLDEFHTPDGRSGGRMLERADLNGDGAVTLEEATQARDERMAKHMEKMAERQAKMANRMETLFAKMDADGDGAVTQEEMRLYAFNRMDENQDGYLSADEFKHARKHRKMSYNHHQRDKHRQWDSE